MRLPIARAAVDLILEAHTNSFTTAVKALGESRELVVAAMQNEIDSLKSRIELLEQDLSYERKRADTLVDRLLVRDARVAAVAPAAIAAATEHDILEGKKRPEILKIFDEVAQVGEGANPHEPRGFDFAGGGKGVQR